MKSQWIWNCLCTGYPVLVLWLFIILEIRVALISYSFIIKGDIEGCQEQWADRSDKPPLSPLLAVPQPEWGMGKPDDGYHCKQQLLVVVGLPECSP